MPRLFFYNQFFQSEISWQLAFKLGFRREGMSLSGQTKASPFVGTLVQGWGFPCSPAVQFKCSSFCELSVYFGSQRAGTDSGMQLCCYTSCLKIIVTTIRCSMLVSSYLMMPLLGNHFRRRGGWLKILSTMHILYPSTIKIKKCSIASVWLKIK